MITDIHVGFCSVCGIIRKDAVINGKRVPITNCPCTAALFHVAGCDYLRMCGSYIDLAYCEQHKLFPCEECDCTCNKENSDGTAQETMEATKS
jgi:hypothetical protein